MRKTNLLQKKIASLVIIVALLSMMALPATATAAATPVYAGDLVVGSSYALNSSNQASQRYVRLTATEQGYYEIDVDSSIAVNGALYSDEGLTNQIASGSEAGNVFRWSLGAQLAKGQSVYLLAYNAYDFVVTQINIAVIFRGVPITAIALSPATLSLAVGTSATLSANITPVDTTDRNLTWLSSNSGIAQVSAAGKVTALSKGVATLSALSSMGVFGQCTVTVSDASAPSDATLQRAYARILYAELNHTKDSDTGPIALRDLKIKYDSSISLRGGAVESYPGVVFGTTSGYGITNDGFFDQVRLSKSSFSGTNLATYSSKFKDMISWVPANGTDLQKASAVFSYLCRNVFYDYTLQYGSASYYSYGALCNGMAQCSGYASAFLTAMNYLKIPCVTVSANLSGSIHSWNMVKIGSDWYNVDATNKIFLYSTKTLSAVYDQDVSSSACYPAVKDGDNSQVQNYQAPQSTPAVQSFTLSASKITMGQNDCKTLTISSVLPQGSDGRLATFSSSNPQVAAVSLFGTLVTGTTAGKALITCKLGSATQTTEVEVLPVAPTLISATASASSITVKWQKAAGVDGYYLYRKAGSTAARTKIATLAATATSYTDKAVSGCTNYTYTLCAYQGTNTSGYNATGVSATFVATPALKSVANGSGYSKLTWSKVAGVDGYKVYRKTTGGWLPLATVKKDTTLSYSDKSVKSGTAYRYTVQAYKGSTSGGYNTTGLYIRYLAVPKLGSAKRAKKGSNSITVTWSGVTNASGYYIYRKTTGGWVKVASVKSTARSWTDTKTRKGTKYAYTVRAWNKTGTVISLSAYNTTGVSFKP